MMLQQSKLITFSFMTLLLTILNSIQVTFQAQLDFLYQKLTKLTYLEQLQINHGMRFIEIITFSLSMVNRVLISIQILQHSCMITLLLIMTLSMVSQAQHGQQNVKIQLKEQVIFMKLFINYYLNQSKITIMKSVERRQCMAKKMLKDKKENTVTFKPLL